MKPLTLDEKGLLIRALLELSPCRKRDHLVAIFLFHYGLSVSEVCSLQLAAPTGPAGRVSALRPRARPAHGRFVS